LALMLDEMGWDVYLEAWDHRAVKTYGGRLKDLFYKSQPSSYDIKLRVSHPDSFDTFAWAEFNVALTAWESTYVPPSFAERIDRLDLLFVPSLYDRDVFQSQLDTKTNCGV